METRISLEKFCDDMRDIFKFDEDDDFTLKWLDEEGDPCTISCQQELDEAIRLYELNRDSELVIHLFKGIPDEPGRLCDGETKEEAEKENHKFGFIRQASARFFRSIKQAHRNISGSLSSVLSRQSTEPENTCQSEKSKNGKTRRPHSIALGQEFKLAACSFCSDRIWGLEDRVTNV
ncbi:hypothetical protein OS493_006558 [Desmophyllum pertusum]|uniref:PB1 domain-containing protein n=1 Tax=Desmophyllum pertusum TaxID=174260 RepID=A0A9X0A515_9CNID|nr:hypothetical protein OS493_006558 [Desmophyllum pertusum]